MRRICTKGCARLHVHAITVGKTFTKLLDSEPEYGGSDEIW